MNERFIYISSIGFCVFFAWFFTDFIPVRIKNKKTSKTIIISCLTIIFCFYSVKTVSRNRAWKNDYILSTTDVKVSSNSARCNRFAGQDIFAKAKLIMNDPIKQEKLYNKAISYLEKSVELYPGGNYTDALYLLAHLYYNKKDFSNALKYYVKCLSYENYLNETIHKEIQVVANSVGGLLGAKDTKSSPQEILDGCDEVLKLIPDFGEIIHLKAFIYGKYFNDIPRSIKLFEEANAIDKFEKTGVFYKDMGTTYAMVNNYDKGLFYLLKSVQLDSSDYRTYTKIAAVYHHLGDFRNANKYLSIAQEKEKKLSDEKNY